MEQLRSPQRCSRADPLRLLASRHTEGGMERPGLLPRIFAAPDSMPTGLRGSATQGSPKAVRINPMT